MPLPHGRRCPTGGAMLRFSSLLLLSGCNPFAPPAIAPERDSAAPAPVDAGAPSPPADAAPDAGAFDLWPGFPDLSGELPPAGPPPGAAADVVYAHSGSDLFRVDPETLDVSRVGPFTITDASGRVRYLNTVTDIAVDRERQIVGITYTEVLQIDPGTAACRVLSALPMGGRFNGLSWIYNTAGPEELMATGLDGSVYRIDPRTGASQRVGSLGGGLRSSGDLVSVATFGTLITLQGPGSDRLARMDPATGAATIIGPTGFEKIWGLGFWKNRVFGFTQLGQFILIDPRTGAGMLVRSIPAFPFWGAGVTTAAVVIE